MKQSSRSQDDRNVRKQKSWQNGSRVTIMRCLSDIAFLLSLIAKLYRRSVTCHTERVMWCAEGRRASVFFICFLQPGNQIKVKWFPPPLPSFFYRLTKAYVCINLFIKKLISFCVLIVLYFSQMQFHFKIPILQSLIAIFDIVKWLLIKFCVETFGVARLWHHWKIIRK